MNKNIIYIGVVVVIVIGFFASMIALQSDEDTDLDYGATPTETVTPEATVTPTSTATPTPTGGSEPVVIDEDWVEYSNSSVGFTIEHPETMEISEPPVGGVSFSYWGPTQEEATELYDGINVTISRTAIPDRFSNLEEYARDQLDNALVNGEIVEPLEEVTVNGMDGYSFTVESLGIINHLVLEYSTDMALYVTYLAPDPDDKGYSKVVDRMLSTLKI